jgi:hypothetical protein
MPASFCFKKSDGTNEELATIDDKCAEFFGTKPDEKYAPFMDMLSDFGLGILMRMGGVRVDENIFNKWIIEISTKEPERYSKITTVNDGKLVECLRKFLYQDYVFEAWR